MVRQVIVSLVLTVAACLALGCSGAQETRSTQAASSGRDLPAQSTAMSKQEKQLTLPGG